MKNRIIFFVTLLTLSFSARTQGVGINETGANPNPSAILDIESTNKGFLPPRMTFVQMNAIVNPATGLIVYCTDCNPLGLHQFGTSWTPVFGTPDPIVVNNCNVNGFQGMFFSGLNYPGRSFSATVTNNTFSTVVLNFTTSDLVLSGITGMTVGTPTGVPALSGGNATLAAGASVLVTYPITGAPSNTGALIGTWTKLSLNCIRTVEVQTNPYPLNYNHCNTANPTAIVEVMNATTNRVWMDRNLGANRAATSSTDIQGYGTLFQWGRRADGHQCVNRYTGDGVTTSSSTAALSTVDAPANGNFITINTGNNDWRNPQNQVLWQGLNGTNNPCPSGLGFRLPTEAELDAERLSWGNNNSIGAFNSPLKFTLTGLRNRVDGTIASVGTSGNYWTSTVNSINANMLSFTSTTATSSASNRAFGRSVRCVKEIDGEVGALDCNDATISGVFVAGYSATGVSINIPYTGGNSGIYNGQTVSSAGVTGLTATLNEGLFANGAGTLTYSISGTPTSTGTASFAINIGGQSCTISAEVVAGAITNLNCTGASSSQNLVSGLSVSGVNLTLPYSGGNGGTHNGQTINSIGVTGLTAELTAGNFAAGAGVLTYHITGTPSTIGTASFAMNIGGESCTVNMTVQLFDCASATHNGTLSEGEAASGVNSVISYVAGDGSSHSGQVVPSTGVFGLTATLSAGSFASGAGTLTYSITGTPITGGTATFAINIGGQSCTLERTVTLSGVPNICNTSSPTAIVDVINPVTGATWMDRNLGANRAATSSTDAESYGSLYQWGRGSDGHQCVNRYAGDGVTTSMAQCCTVNTDTPPHGNFLYTFSGPDDWRSPQNDNLWQGVNGVNNPCPSGYRVPTVTELNAERLSWVVTPISSTNTSAGAFASPLKLPTSGARDSNSGSIGSIGSGFYWSSTVGNGTSSNLLFNSSNAFMNSIFRASGFSVRCIKD